METEKVTVGDFIPKNAGTLDNVMADLYTHLEDEDLAEFKEKAKDTLLKIKEAKKLIRIYEASLAKDYQMFKDGIL